MNLICLKAGCQNALLGKSASNRFYQQAMELATFLFRLLTTGGNMRKFGFILVLLLIVTSSSFAQRHGATETGGYFSFRNVSGSGIVSQNYLDIQWLLGYYFNRNFLLEIEPDLAFNFGKDSTHISFISLAGLSYRIIDMAPYDYRRMKHLRMKDLGASAGVFATISGGLWSESITYSNEKSSSGKGPALALSVGTHSAFGKFTLLRTKAQWIYLFPSGSTYLKSRSIFQISVGFSVFVRI